MTLATYIISIETFIFIDYIANYIIQYEENGERISQYYLLIIIKKTRKLLLSTWVEVRKRCGKVVFKRAIKTSEWLIDLLININIFIYALFTD